MSRDLALEIKAAESAVNVAQTMLAAAELLIAAARQRASRARSDLDRAKGTLAYLRGRLAAEAEIAKAPIVVTAPGISGRSDKDYLQGWIDAVKESGYTPGGVIPPGTTERLAGGGQ